MAKKEYERLELEIILIESMDIVTLSDQEGNDEWGDDMNWDE